MAKEEDRLRASVEEALKGAKRREAARDALAIFFPKVEKALETFVPGSTDQSERMRGRRISARDFASTYFRLDPQPTSWGRSEITEILENPIPRDALSTVEDRIGAAVEADRPRLRRLFLDALDGAFGEKKPLTIEWLSALVEVSPRYIAAKDGSEDFLAADPLAKLTRLLHKGLESASPDDRFELFDKAVAGARDLVLLADFFRGHVGDLNPKGSTRESEAAYFGTKSEALRTKILDRIRELAAANQFWDQSAPGDLLWFWWGGDLEAEVYHFTGTEMQSLRGLRVLLEVPISTVQSSAGNYEHVNRRQWSKIVDLDALSQKATGILEESAASDEDKTRARRFLAALEKNKESPF